MPRKSDPSKPIRPTPVVLTGEAKRAAQDHICEQVAEGRFLRVICREDPGMPAFRTVHDWRNEDPEFEARYRQARLDGFDVMAENTKDLIDESPRMIESEFGKRVDSGWVQWRSKQVDHHMKLLSKFDPARYGDKIEHTGRMQLTDLSDEQLDAKLAALEAAAKAAE